MRFKMSQNYPIKFRNPYYKKFGIFAFALCGLISANANAEGQNFSAQIKYTEFGIPHIKAKNLAGAGFGYGFAMARDNLCAVDEKMVTLAGERSQTMDPDGKYLDLFAGGEVINYQSDAAYKYILSDETVKYTKNGASKDVRDLVAGYVSGFNKHIAAKALDGEDCRSQKWFRPITEDDIWRRIAQVPLLETSAGVFREIINATPPNQQANITKTKLANLPKDQISHGASNAMAFGKEGVENGVGGLSFANPHYAWHGTERLHVFHMKVPGKIDVFGATAYGLPFPMLGFTPNVGWGITHTTDKRSTLYELKLDPNNPKNYLYDNVSIPLKPLKISINTNNGAREHTFWLSQFGPVVMGAALPWNKENAYVFADPERKNNRFADTFYGIASAKNVSEIKDVQLKKMGSPWSNVTAADSSGNVLYSNISVTANITDKQLNDCVVTSKAKQFMDYDVTVLDGSRAYCAWTIDKNEPYEGIIPAKNRPWTIRKDVMFNSNDSHWYHTLDPKNKSENFAKVIGPEKTTRGERTRVAAYYAKSIINGSEITGSKGATPSKFEKLFFSAHNITADMIVDDLVNDCTQNPKVKSAKGLEIDIKEGCEALKDWDRRDTLNSRGSAFFAQFLSYLEQVPMTGFALTDKYWRVPFDPKDPVNTPRGFISTDETRAAFAEATIAFAQLGVKADAKLGDMQSVTREGVTYPISGSRYSYHMTRPMAYAPLKGITEIRSGDSYIHDVAIKPSGVSGRFIVTYSQSTNPKSPHFSDFTKIYSQEKFADVYFSDEQISKNQIGETVNIVSDKKK